MKKEQQLDCNHWSADVVSIVTVTLPALTTGHLLLFTLTNKTPYKNRTALPTTNGYIAVGCPTTGTELDLDYPGW
jgi:hypothetical protein